jgi:hypothetical protein
MDNIIEKKFHQILLEIPELAHIFPELEHELNSHLLENSKPKSAKKILEDIIDRNASKSGGQPQMNFYPSEKKVGCFELCIGIATMGYGFKRDDEKNRTGFKGLINEIIEYWITCGSVNKKTILLTTQWKDDDFEEKWKSIVDAYRAKGKQVIIIEVWKENYIVRYPS